MFYKMILTIYTLHVKRLKILTYFRVSCTGYGATSNAISITCNSTYTPSVPYAPSYIILNTV